MIQRERKRIVSWIIFHMKSTSEKVMHDQDQEAKIDVFRVLPRIAFTL